MLFSAPQVTTSNPCPISETREAVVVCSKDRHGKNLRNVMNLKSGLIYVDPVPFENTELFYQNDYRKSYKGVHQPKPKHVYRAGKVALARYERLKELLPKTAKCLDAGSSSGEFVYLLQSRGHLSQGVEANIPYAEYSKAELEIPVSVSPFSEFSTDDKFDLITMFHVLEHLEHPIRDLNHLGNLLKPGGYFVIEVPNILYPNMAFSHKWHPGHLFSFTDKTLSAMMEKAGFQTISCNSICNGGNLWGVFRQCTSMKKNIDNDGYFSSHTRKTLLRNAILYHIRFWNYFKFLPRAFKNLFEKRASMNMRTRKILNMLF